MMNRLGPPVTGGVQVPILSRLGPAVNSAPEGGNAPKKSPVKITSPEPKSEKAGQVFYNNMKVTFKDGKIFDGNQKLLSTGGVVRFQNGRLEYLGGTKVQGAGKKAAPNKGNVSPKSRGMAAVINLISGPAKTPETAPTKSRLKPPPISVTAKPAVSAPAKPAVSAPAKTPETAPAKSRLKPPPMAAPAKTPETAPAKSRLKPAPITAPGAEPKKVVSLKTAPAKAPIKAPVRTPITFSDAEDEKVVSPKPTPAKPPVNVPVKAAITAPVAEAKKVTPPKVLAKKAKLKGGVVSRLGPAISNGVAAVSTEVNNKRKTEEQTQPAKRVKEIKPVPQVKDLVVKSILNVSPNRRTVDLVCVMPGEDNAIIKLQKAPFGSDVHELQAYLNSTSQTVSWQTRNVSNVKLSTTGTSGKLYEVNAEVTYPANESQIANLKKSCPPRILRETPEFYKDRVMPYIRQWLPANQPQNWKWIDDILSGNVNKDRVVGSNSPEGRPENGYTLVKDIKWANAGIENDLEDMHILGISHRKDIFCLRDLTAEHLPLLKGLYHGGTSMVRSKYGIQVEDQLVFLLYYPTTYHLHVHFTTWGKYEELARLGEAHLLVDVISNLEDVDPHYYRKVTLNVIVNKSYEFLYNTQEGTIAPPKGMQSQQQQGTGNAILDLPNNGIRPQPQPIYRDPTDPFWQLQAALLNILGRFQEVLHGNFEFLRLPIKELMKHILNQPRDLMDRIAIPLKELLHHLENRPLDHMPQLEGVLAELLQFFQKNPLERMMDPAQNQMRPMQTSNDYLRGYEMPRYQM